MKYESEIYTLTNEGTSLFFFTKLGTRRIDKKLVVMMDDPQYNHIKYVPICTQSPMINIFISNVCPLQETWC